jgi:Tfp pilus assembly protein PilE
MRHSPEESADVHVMTARTAPRHTMRDAGAMQIELVLVFALVGILLSIAAISISGMTMRSSNASCRASRTALTSGAEAYWVKRSVYPIRTTVLTTGSERFIDDLSGSLVTGTPSGGTQVDTITAKAGGWKLTIRYDTTGATAPVISASGSGSAGC